MKKHFSTFLIIAGLLIIAIPLGGRFVASRRQAELMEGFLEQAEAEVASENLEDLSEVFDWNIDEGSQLELDIGMNEARAMVDAFESGQPLEDTGSNLSDAETIKQKPSAIGTIKIDKIGVYLPVAEGDDLATLKFSLGHMPDTAALGTVGNAVVAGHRSHSFGTFFNRLDEVAVGDTIEVKSTAGNYTYEVYETKVVEPDDLSVLRGSSNHRVLTLITCTPIYTSTHRLIVHAVVKEEN